MKSKGLTAGTKGKASTDDMKGTVNEKVTARKQRNTSHEQVTAALRPNGLKPTIVSQ